MGRNAGGRDGAVDWPRPASPRSLLSLREGGGGGGGGGLPRQAAALRSLQPGSSPCCPCWSALPGGPSQLLPASPALQARHRRSSSALRRCPSCPCRWASCCLRPWQPTAGARLQRTQSMRRAEAPARTALQEPRRSCRGRQQAAGARQAALCGVPRLPRQGPRTACYALCSAVKRGRSRGPWRAGGFLRSSGGCAAG